MAGLEIVVRPFGPPTNGPAPFYPAGAVNVPPVRFSVGIVGGNKTFSYSQTSNMTSYMADVHKEQTSTAFNMETGKLFGQ